MIEAYIAPDDHERVTTCHTYSFTSISSWSSNVPSKTNQLKTYETVERCDNDVCGPKAIWIDNSTHEISNTEKNQINNFLSRNNEPNLHDTLKWVINLYRTVKTDNIYIQDIAGDGFKTITKKRRRRKSQKFDYSKTAASPKSSENSNMESKNKEIEVKNPEG